MVLAPGTQLGPYEIESLIGSGGLIGAVAPVVAGDQMVLLLGNYRGDIWIRDIG